MQRIVGNREADAGQSDAHEAREPEHGERRKPVGQRQPVGDERHGQEKHGLDDHRGSRVPAQAPGIEILGHLRLHFFRETGIVPVRERNAGWFHAGNLHPETPVNKVREPNPSMKDCSVMRQVPVVLHAMILGAILAQSLPAQEAWRREVPPPLRAALDSARTHNQWTLAQQTSICEIPAPPFKEGPRAAEMAKRLTALGLTRVRLDGIGNVLAEYPGRGRKPLIVLSAHLDTVFPESTDVRVRRDGTLFRGPGIADDCRGLAVLLVTARALIEAKVPFSGTILFAATVGEEGLGNGRGVRHLFEKELPGQVDYFLTVDVNEFEVVNRAAGSRRYEVTFEAPGGHSYSDFPMPHPIHALGRAIAKVGAFEVPSDPKTTFNVGIVRGGTAVNAIAASAAMVVDLRSESGEELARLDARFRRAVEEAVAEERARWPMSSAPLTARWDTLGIRPGGVVAESSTIARMAVAAGKQLGVSVRFASASTDANIPMSLGIPALAVGHGGRGTAEHSLTESYEDGPQGYRGPQWLLLLAAALDRAPAGSPQAPRTSRQSPSWATPCGNSRSRPPLGLALSSSSPKPGQPSSGPRRIPTPSSGWGVGSDIWVESARRSRYTPGE